MKVLAINSSPRKEGESKTELMLTHLVKGMRDEKAEVEVVNLRQKEIKYCISCYTCWTKTPGRCAHNDDMTNELFPKFIEADLVVYATPLYVWTMNANLKAFMERAITALEPYLINFRGKTLHPFRTRIPALVMLSVAGAYEDSAFGPLSSWANFVYGPGLIAEIYRTSSEAMVQPIFEEQLGDILNATEQAGRELVVSLNISHETIARITQPIIGANDITIANVIWQTCIDQGITPSEMVEKGIMPDFESSERINDEMRKKSFMPPPETIENFRTLMRTGFNTEAAQGLKAVIQFNFIGDVDGSCYLKVENGNSEARLGKAEKPDLIIDTPFKVV